ncbi:MAG: hypothetical protein PHE83_05970 [Opitutaceae bacterium]|nr:hypothetical protein [Opitutaceae bacterium]
MMRLIVFDPTIRRWIAVVKEPIHFDRKLIDSRLAADFTAEPRREGTRSTQQGHSGRQDAKIYWSRGIFSLSRSACKRAEIDRVANLA